MAKPGPKPKVITSLDAVLVERIDDWIDSERLHSAERIFDHFDLAAKGINKRTFRHYVRQRRQAGRSEGRPPALPDGAAAEDLLMDLLIDRAEAGDAKHFTGIASALRALQDRRRVDIQQAADERAAELHSVKMAEVRKALEAAKREADSRLDRLAVEKGIPADVNARIKDLYGVAV